MIRILIRILFRRFLLLHSFHTLVCNFETGVIFGGDFGHSLLKRPNNFNSLGLHFLTKLNEDGRSLFIVRFQLVFDLCRGLFVIFVEHVIKHKVRLVLPLHPDIVPSHFAFHYLALIQNQHFELLSNCQIF